VEDKSFKTSVPSRIEINEEVIKIDITSEADEEEVIYVSSDDTQW